MRGAILVLFVCGITSATTMQLLTLDELTDSAQVIVIATVLSSETQWEKRHTDISTFTSIEVTTLIKPQSWPFKQFTLRHPGGRPRDFQNETWNMAVSGVPLFRNGQKALFFLRKKGAYFELVGWAQGIFHVRKDARGQEVVTRDLQDIQFVNEIPDDGSMDTTLNAMVSMIRKKMK